MRRLSGWVLVCLLAISWSVTEATGPAAAATRCGTRGNYFNGYYQQGRPEYRHTGASSYLVVRDGALCRGVSGDGNFTNAWVMIAGQGARDWGQIGFERTHGYTLRWFAQFSDDDTLNTWYSTYRVDNQIGKRHAFRVLYNKSTRQLDASIDGQVKYQSVFDPAVSWGAQPWSPQFFAETGHRETDVPGRAATPTAFSGLGVQRADTGAVVTMPCILSAATSTTRWGRAASSCSAFTVWTK